MKKKIVFMGTPEFARIVLEELTGSQEIEILALFCQPDRIFGRKQDLKAPETKSFAENLGIKFPIFQPEKLDDACVDAIKKLKPDAVIVVAYGQILPESVLELNCINIHASLLPKYRGASPIQEMILRDEEFFGVCAMRMRASLDSGEILGLMAFRNDGQIPLSELSKKLAQASVSLLLDVLKTKLIPMPQAHAKASFCKKIKKQEGCVDFHDALELTRKARAYEGWPGVFLESGLKLFGIKMTDRSGEVGEILEVDGEGVVVGCGKKAVKISHLQAPGKQILLANVYVSGHHLKVGDILK